MSDRGVKILLVLLLLGLAILACRSFGPPETCGENLGGVADTAKFDQYFVKMALVNAATGEPGPEGEAGIQFSVSDTLDLRADTKSEVAVRVCIQDMSRGSIAFDQTQTFAEGSSSMTLGIFQAGGYIARVIVDNVLIKSVAFEVK